MRGRTRTIVVALAALALVALPLAAAGCGSSAEDDKGTWEKVLSAEVSGKEPVKLNLGTAPAGHRGASRVGPHRAPSRRR